MDRTSLNKDKSGVFTGGYVKHPVTGESLPIWIADYVLASYGTGAVMGVPAHDERDFEFASKYDLPIVSVIEHNESGCYEGDGPHIHSDFLNGLHNAEAITTMIDWLEAKGKGQRQVNYRLRDWLFSRQRYWGEPIPVIHWEDGSMSLVPEDQLPLRLPVTDKIQPSGTGESPLAAIEDWVNVVDPETGRKGRRETNTMPQWAGSSWYYLRYIDPQNSERLADPDKLAKWLPVDLYIGGAEHAVLHLLYARFWHKFLYDLGVVPTKEPFMKLFNQGMILGTDGNKMSKSKGNVVNPDHVVDQYGADTLRVYEMFMGPLDASIAWSENGLESTRRFLDRIWRLYVSEDGSLSERIQDAENPALERVYHQTVKKVTEDYEILHFNTAISQMMIFLNATKDQAIIPKAYAQGLIQLLAPLAPHISEEIWQKLGYQDSISQVAWPSYEEALTIEDQVEVVVQINGKIKAKVMVEANMAADALGDLALNLPEIQAQLEGKTLRKVVAIPNRLVNIVAN